MVHASMNGIVVANCCIVHASFDLHALHNGTGLKFRVCEF